jgi:ribonuclease HI
MATDDSQAKEKPTVTIYTDGGCDPNPGAGGWAALLLFEKDGKIYSRELSGSEPETTNNRMELTAAIHALRALKQPCVVELHTDSQYLKRGINEWMANWERTNFKNGKIQNADLWQTLKAEMARHEINWHWVKGHAGDPHNERVDQLATAAIRAQSADEGAQDQPDDAGTRAYLGISCKGSPGVGGWAVVLNHDGKQMILTGGHPSTNANRLDLLAAIAALEAIPEGESIQIFTWNTYLRDGITRWIEGWKKSNWIKKTGGEVQYRNLWQHLDRLAKARNVKWETVKPDNRPPEMERLDDALREAMEAASQMTEAPSEPEFKV